MALLLARRERLSNIVLNAETERIDKGQAIALKRKACSDNKCFFKIKTSGIFVNSI